MGRRRTYPGSIEKRGDAFRVSLVVGGERFRKTFRNVTREQVEGFLRQQHEQMCEDTKRRSQGMPIGDETVLILIDQFREDRYPDLAPSTLSGYKTTLDRFEEWLRLDKAREQLTVRDVSAAHLTRFLRWLRQNAYAILAGKRVPITLKSPTLNRHRAALQSMFTYAADDLALRDSNPVRKVTKKKYDEREPVLLDDGDYEAFLVQCEKRGPMHEMYALFLGETGARSLSEALWLRWEDVDLSGGWVRIVQGRDDHRTKTGKGRDVPMTQRLRPALRRHFAEYRFDEHDRREGGQTIRIRSPWVFHHIERRRHAEAGSRFFSLQRGLKSAAADAGIDGRWRVHDLRHRRCTSWLAADKSPAKVQEALGHSSITTTMKYYSFVKEHLRSLVDDDSQAEAG